MTESQVRDKYEVVPCAAMDMPCQKCAVKVQCDEQADRNSGPNPYFRTCHDDGYLKLKEKTDE